MDFEYSDRTKALLEKLNKFMDEVIYPAEPSSQDVAEYLMKMKRTIDAQPGPWSCLVDQRELKVMEAWGFQYKANIVLHKVRKDGHSDGRGVGFYFICDDADGLYAEWTGRGLTLAPPTIADYGMKQLFVPEPDGYSICFESPTEAYGAKTGC